MNEMDKVDIGAALDAFMTRAEADDLRAENARLRRWLRLPVRERLIEHMLMVAEEVNGELALVGGGKCSQAAMAEAIGTHRESVCRAIQGLERDELITRKRREGARAARRIVLSATLARRAAAEVAL